MDPATQLALAFIYVAASGTVPTGITAVDIYRENVEWTSSAVGGTFNLASTNFPYEGTKDIEGTAVIAGNYVQLVAPSPIDLATVNNLTLYIRSKATWVSTKALQLTWFNVADQLGNTITIRTGQFGFDSSITSTYQQIQIPIGLFDLGGVAIDRLRITCVGGGAAIGMYIDAITLQSGIAPPTPPTSTAGMIWKGAWNGTVAYAVNDVVSLSNRTYVAIVANTNSSPPSANWSVVAYGNVTAAATLTSTAVVTGAGTTAVQTPSATTTLDSSGNYSSPGGASFGVGGAPAGRVGFGQGTTPTAGANEVVLYGHSAITGYKMRLPSAAASGLLRGTNTAGDVVLSQAELSGDATTSGSNAVTVVKINGITITGTPSTGYVPTATSSSAATWQAVPAAVHGPGGTFASSDGVTPVAAGVTSYFTVPYSCTINSWNITVSPSGTATVDVWKNAVGSGTAIPTVADTITASATPAISTGTKVHSTTLTGWNTAVVANDTFGINLKTVGGSPLFVTLTMGCQ